MKLILVKLFLFNYNVAKKQEAEFVYIDFVYQPMFDSQNQVTGIFVKATTFTESHLLTQQIR